MKRYALAVGLMFMAVLTACNLANAPGQGGGETIISGAPVVRIAAPLPNATYLEGVSVNIQAAVSNAGADIDRVEILVDNEIAATLPQPNTGGTPIFSVAQTWTAAGEGQHTIGVTAFRADGSSSETASVNVTVVAQGAQASPTRTPGGAASDVEATREALGTLASEQNPVSGGQQVNASPAASNTPAPPTNSPEPEATDTPSRPTASFTQGVNLRRGPSIKFAPPVGSYATGQTADILAKTQAGDWYKIRGANGEGWVSAQFVTVSGDASQIPIDNGPPVPADTATPVPFTATPVATAVPATTANIVLGNVGITPALPIKCNQTVEFKIDVANLGQQATSTGGSISIKDFWNGQEQASTTGAFPVINAGQTLNIGGIFLTVSTNVSTEHKLIITLNPGGAVPETTTGDNSREYAYTLVPC